MLIMSIFPLQFVWNENISITLLHIYILLKISIILLLQPFMQKFKFGYNWCNHILISLYKVRKKYYKETFF